MFLEAFFFQTIHSCFLILYTKIINNKKNFHLLWLLILIPQIPLLCVNIASVCLYMELQTRQDTLIIILVLNVCVWKVADRTHSHPSDTFHRGSEGLCKKLHSCHEFLFQIWPTFITTPDNMVKKKIDNRIRILIENGMLLGHRTLVVLVGDKSRDQVCKNICTNNFVCIEKQNCWVDIAYYPY